MSTRTFNRVVALGMTLIMSLTPINISEAAVRGLSTNDNIRKEERVKIENELESKLQVEEELGDKEEKVEDNEEIELFALTKLEDEEFEATTLTEDEPEETTEKEKLEEQEETLDKQEEAEKDVEKKGRRGALDWFEEVQYILKRGTDAYITDVDTGKSFWVRRTFGTNHADIEPLTKEDSDIIKDIWNGWSWDRRAVVVQVGDDILAGAMSAMPHAGLDSAPAVNYVSGRSAGYGYGQNLDAIKNNGADGVMDLHFKNSRTHSTNRVQSSMQNMVVKADQYIKDMGY